LTFEALLVVLGGVAAAALGAALFLGLEPRPRAAAQDLGRGAFAATLAAAPTGADAARDDLFAAAVAARHLLDFDRAAALLDRILADDPGDGEAWLERGLAAAYAGDPERAAAALQRASALRADLAESILLHRAWLALRRGDPGGARLLFEEIEAPLENKLRTDMGSREPLFAEWLLQAAVLWRAQGDEPRARWAWSEALRAAPESRLHEIVGDPA
jgi:tetratricopeptide (TPR) repeat protein